MVYLIKNNKEFANQTNLGWTFSFEANGKYPIIANRIFATKAGAESFLLNATAIPGLILRVIEDTAANNGAYLIEKNGESLKLTKLFTGTPEISGRMVDVVLANDNKPYEKSDCTWDPLTEKWVPNQGATPLSDPEQNIDEDGKYLQLWIKPSDFVYIKSSELIDLSDYYTKSEINASLNIINSSISELRGITSDLSINTVRKLSSNSSYIIIEPSTGVGNVILDVSVKNSSDAETFNNTCLISDGYLDEKLDIFNWEEIS